MSFFDLSLKEINRLSKNFNKTGVGKYLKIISEVMLLADFFVAISFFFTDVDFKSFYVWIFILIASVLELIYYVLTLFMGKQYFESLAESEKKEIIKK